MWKNRWHIYIYYITYFTYFLYILLEKYMDSFWNFEEGMMGWCSNKCTNSSTIQRWRVEEPTLTYVDSADRFSLPPTQPIWEPNLLLILWGKGARLVKNWLSILQINKNAGKRVAIFGCTPWFQLKRPAWLCSSAPIHLPDPLLF